MRATVFTAFACFACCLFPPSPRADEIELTVEVPAPQLWQDANGFSHLDIQGFQNFGRPGEPALPGKAVMVLLPPGHAAVSVAASPVERSEVPGTVVVFPVQKQFPPSHTGPRPFTGPDLALYQSPAPFPLGLVKAESTQSKRGFAVLPVLIRPASYLPATGKLSVVQAVTLKVVTAPVKETLFPTAKWRGLDRDADALRALVANPGLLSSYSKVRAPSSSDDHRYVIVTSQALSQCSGGFTLQKLAADKNARGISTRIMTMEDIKAGFQGRDDAEKVRNYLRDEYQNHGTDWALMAGDADLQVVGGETEPVIVPVRGLWGDIDYGGPELNYISDLYYACLDGDFNANGNDVFGEEDDQADLLAELEVGRAPVDNCTEVANFVRKTLAYQNSTGDYLKNAWMAAEWLAPNVYGSSIMEAIRTGSSDEGLTTRGFIDNPFFQVQTLYDPNPDGSNWGPSDILAVLNGGMHLLNHLGHSMTNNNMRLSCDDIDQDLTNNEPFFEYTGGCYPGSFDNRLDPVYSNNLVSPQDSFVEHLLLGEHGAFAAIMFTRYGTGDTMQRTFWDAAFSFGMKRLGQMHNHSREALAAWIMDRYVRWQYYGLNLFGDPELSFHMSNSVEPVLGVPREQLQFIAAFGKDKPADQRFAVRNDGGGELAWSVTSDSPWLQASPASGTAPTEVTVSVDPGALTLGEHKGTLTFSSPQAANSPQTVPVDLYLLVIPQLPVPFASTAPAVDGVISSGEYDTSAFMDIGLVAPGYSVGRLLTDGQALYLAFDITDDTTDSAGDALMLMFDTDNDHRWPATPAADGHYTLFANGKITFTPDTNPGTGFLAGTPEDNPAGVTAAWSTASGHRVIEVRIDLSQSHLKVQPGGSFGMFLEYYNVNGQNYDVVGIWPSSVWELDDSAFFGDMTIGIEPDLLVAKPSTLSFTAVAGGQLSEPVQLQIEATTATPLDFTLTTSNPWIRMSVNTGATPATVEVRADPGALSSGDQKGSLRISAVGAKNSPLNLPVSLTVSEPPPVFGLEPSSLSFTMTEGGKLPDAQGVSIDNRGGGMLSFVIIAAGDWYDLSAATGTAPASLTVIPKATNLPAGVYTGILLCTAPGAQPATLPLSLTVSAQAKPPQPKDSGGCSTTSPSGTAWFGLLLALWLWRRRS